MDTAGNEFRSVSGAAASEAAGRRGGQLALAVFAVGAIVLSLGNGLLLSLMIGMMPKNDFGRPLWSTIAYLRGADMYAANNAVRFQVNASHSIELFNLSPPHFHLFLLPLALLPEGVALLVWCVLSGICFYLALEIVRHEIGLELTHRGRQWTVLGLLASSHGRGCGHGPRIVPLDALDDSGLARRPARALDPGRSLLGSGYEHQAVPPGFRPLPPSESSLARGYGRGANDRLFLLAGSGGFWRREPPLLAPEAQHGPLLGLAANERLAVRDAKPSIHGQPCVLPLARLDDSLIRRIWLCVAIPAGVLTLIVSLIGSSEKQTDCAFGILLVSALLFSPLGWIYYFWLPLGPIASLAAGWWRDRLGPIGADRERRSLWCRRLLLASSPGLFFPILVTTSGQPPPLATFVLGSIFFWSLLLVWLALILDGLPDLNTRSAARPLRSTLQGERDASIMKNPIPVNHVPTA